jgi:hypothetical protein
MFIRNYDEKDFDTCMFNIEQAFQLLILRQKYYNLEFDFQISLSHQDKVLL